MSQNQPDFQSLKVIRDNATLLSVGNEFLGRNIFLQKIGNEITESASVLKDDIKTLKKQFPGKFATEVDTDKVMSDFDDIAQKMLSCDDEIKSSCESGELGKKLCSNVKEITESIGKIWIQVKGSEIKYKKADSISIFFDRLNIVSNTASLFIKITKMLVLLLVILASVFCYLYFTMEKEDKILNENMAISEFIVIKKAELKKAETGKNDVQKTLDSYNVKEPMREDKIAVIDLETKIQQYNQEIHVLEGLIEIRENELAENNKKLKTLREKTFTERLFKQ